MSPPLLQFNKVIMIDKKKIVKKLLTFLVESLIRVMYWVVAVILNRLFKPLNIKSLHDIWSHICTLRCIVYTLPF